MVQCAGCDLPISDRFLLKVLDRVWHTKCVQCSDCKRSLTDRCYSREEKIYCRQDFYRRYGTKCSGCSQGISPHDLVRRAKSLVFHVQCFQCSMCQKQITTGDELYYIGENRFICKNDYEGTKQATLPVQTELEIEPKEFYQSPYDEDLEYGTKRRGPRTTIKAKQLETLKAAFTATPKPTRLIREKLAQETGLNMRVIQVWFQNRRSKERRMKQNRENGNTTSVSRPNGNRIVRTPRRNSERNGSSESESPDHVEDMSSEPNSIDFSHQDSDGNDVFASSTFNEYFGNGQNNFSDISRASPSTPVTTNLSSLVNNNNNGVFSQPVNSPLQNNDYDSHQTNGNSSSLTPLQPLAVSSRGNFNPGVLQHVGGNAQTVGMW